MEIQINFFFLACMPMKLKVIGRNTLGYIINSLDQVTFA